MEKMINRKMLTDIRLKSPPYLVVGFPGAGLVGSVALAHYCDIMNSRFIGYIDSPEFAPLTSIHNYTPLPAVRIEYIKEHNVVILFSEMSIPVKLSEPLGIEILRFADELKPKLIISLGGIIMSTPKPLFYVASNQSILKKYKYIGTPIKEGATTGVTAVLLSRGYITNKNVLSLLAHVSNDYLDPAAAVEILKALSKVIGNNIDTKELEREVRLLRKQTKEAVSKSKLLDKRLSDMTMYR